MLTCSWVHDPMITGQTIVFFLPWMVWHNRVSSNRSCKTHWSQPFCRRPQGETLGVLDTLFWNSSERTQQQTLHSSPMVCSSYEGGSGHSFALTSYPNTCFSTCLGMSSVVQLVSDFVFTLYVLRQRHGIKVTSPPLTSACDTDDQDEQHVISRCAESYTLQWQ